MAGMSSCSSLIHQSVGAPLRDYIEHQVGSVFPECKYMLRQKPTWDIDLTRRNPNPTLARQRLVKRNELYRKLSRTLLEDQTEQSEQANTIIDCISENGEISTTDECGNTQKLFLTLTQKSFQARDKLLLALPLSADPAAQEILPNSEMHSLGLAGAENWDAPTAEELDKASKELRRYIQYIKTNVIPKTASDRLKKIQEKFPNATAPPANWDQQTFELHQDMLINRQARLKDYYAIVGKYPILLNIEGKVTPQSVRSAAVRVLANSLKTGTQARLYIEDLENGVPILETLHSSATNFLFSDLDLVARAVADDPSLCEFAEAYVAGITHENNELQGAALGANAVGLINPYVGLAVAAGLSVWTLVSIYNNNKDLGVLQSRLLARVENPGSDGFEGKDAEAKLNEQAQIIIGTAAAFLPVGQVLKAVGH
jgi:hypothetical protein